MRRSLFVILGVTVIAGSLLSGCSNTVNGAGHDIENAGEWISDTF